MPRDGPKLHTSGNHPTLPLPASKSNPPGSQWCSLAPSVRLALPIRSKPQRRRRIGSPEGEIVHRLVASMLPSHTPLPRPPPFSSAGARCSVDRGMHLSSSEGDVRVRGTPAGWTPWPLLSRVVRGHCKDTFLMVGRLIRLEQKPSVAALPRCHHPSLPSAAPAPSSSRPPSFILSFCAHYRRIHYQALKKSFPFGVPRLERNWKASQA